MAASCRKVLVQFKHFPCILNSPILNFAGCTHSFQRHTSYAQVVIRKKIICRHRLRNTLQFAANPQAQHAAQVHRNRATYLNTADCTVCTTRPFCSDDSCGGRRMKPVFVAIPNPIKVIRNKMYFWMIRSYFDAEFKAEEFIRGAKQALCTISQCVSEGNFEQLDGLLSKNLLDEVKETCRRLALRDRSNILVNTDDVLHVFPQNFAVHYDERGGKFLNILMRFWCHSMASEESDKGVVGLRIGRPPPGTSEEVFKNMGSVISCTYEFHRDFSAGADPSWVVTYIQHGKWLNTEARWLPKEWS